MEEDIKILEERLKDNRKQFEEIGTHIFLNEDLTTIVENLIKGYRKLEKRNNRQFKLLEKSIPKSKIQEIKEKNEKKIDEMRPYRHQGPFDFGVLNGIDECCRMLLENK